MNVVITTRHGDGQDAAVKAHAEQQAQKLTRYYDLLQEIEVTVDFGRQGHGDHKAEILVNAEHGNEFYADASDTNPLAAVDACVEKLKRQLSEHKEKHRNRKHPG